MPICDDEHTVTKMDDELWEYRAIFSSDGVVPEDRMCWMPSTSRIDGHVWSVPLIIPSRDQVPYRVMKSLGKTLRSTELFELERNGLRCMASISDRRRSESRRPALIRITEYDEWYLELVELHRERKKRFGDTNPSKPWDLAQTISAIEYDDQKPLLLFPHGMKLEG